mgnify:CR=1 FL=1
MSRTFIIPLLRRVALALAAAGLTVGTATAQSLPGSLVYSAPGGVIRDNLVTLFAFTVDAPGVFPADGGLTIRLRNLAAPLAGDVSAVLTYIAPGAGTATRSIRVFDGTGGHDGRTFDGSYSFGSSFVAPLPGSAVRSGDYAMAQAIPSAFFGQPIAGHYQLEVIDWFSNGAATVGGVDLAFDLRSTSTVPEPTPIGLVGAGLLAVGGLTRRRLRA